MIVTESPVHTEDLLPVRSRINWGAILAGAILALSLYFFFGLLGSAVGLSISDNVNANTLGTSAMIYAIAITAICLFVGGYVASQLTTGENKLEGGLYGIFVWATVSAIMLTMMASGMRIGLHAMAGMTAAADNTRRVDWEATARQAGVPQARIEEWKAQAQAAPAEARQAVNDPQNQKAAAEATTRAAWYAFFGVWISMMAAAAGGYVGSGPTLHMLSIATVRTGARQVAPTQA
jgi:uncharacterized membrane protein